MSLFRVPVVILSAAVALAATPALASSGPYPASTYGWDVGSPQCGASLPADGGFGIVGAGTGRPFTTNKCLSSEYTWARGKPLAPSLYINTGYAGAYKGDITAYCSQHTPGLSSSGKLNLAMAWQIGCSEADTAIASAASETSAATPEMWWMDIETSNSWSSASLQLNAETIQGIADRLHGASGMLAATSLSHYVGVYSDAYMWGRIVGSNSVSGIDGTWNANDGNLCNAFISGVPTWLHQAVVNNLDQDGTC